MTPCLIYGEVIHARHVKAGNAFRYAMFTLRLPLSSLSDVAGPLLGVERLRLLSFFNRDHGPRDGSPLLPWIRRILDCHGLSEVCDGEVVLQTMPRLLGFVFNPVSFWFCYDRAGNLRTVLAEVSNTFGERHNYLVAHEDLRVIGAHDVLQAQKVFHVSPFFPVRGEYRFRFQQVAQQHSISIDYFDNGVKQLTTCLVGREQSLTSRALVHAWLRCPLLTFGVVARIHWQALRLVWRRVPFFHKPIPPVEENNMSLLSTNSVLAANQNTFACDRSALVEVPQATLPRSAVLVMNMLAPLRGGSLMIVLPDGTQRMLGEGENVIALKVLDWQVFERILTHGSIGFAEDYMAGLWRCEQLPELLTYLACNRAVLGRAIHGNAWRLALYWLWHRLRPNTRKGSKRNIEAHYDLGNDFYQLWLDESMSYSSALWQDPAQSFEAAQLEKYRYALRTLDAKPGQHILEIGCGWGGFAEVAAKEFGCRVTGLTLSPSQLAWAQARAQREGFSDMASFMLCDYRDARGQYDHIVSIEMIEAVGEAFWSSYFSQLRALLRPAGRAVVQAITIDDDLFATYRKGVDFIQRYIFPGGMLPSPKVFGEHTQRAGLEVHAKHSFGIDYARTLNVWLQRFNAQCDAVLAQGFDERFLRMWQFYLAYCEAGFRARSTDVYQFVLKHGSVS